jgi:hypothetical protein
MDWVGHSHWTRLGIGIGAIRCSGKADTQMFEMIAKLSLFDEYQ